MLVCQVWGDMSAEKSSDAYPTDVYCNECYEAMNVEGEDNPIVTTEKYDPSWGNTCARCGKTIDEEREEQRS